MTKRGYSKGYKPLNGLLSNTASIRGAAASTISDVKKGKRGKTAGSESVSWMFNTANMKPKTSRKQKTLLGMD